MRRRGKEGMTLSEIILSLAILSFVALLIIGLFTALLKASAKNREQAVAELLVDSLLERAFAEGPNGWGVSGLTNQRLEVNQQQSHTRFFYQVTPVGLDSGTDNVGQLYRVDVIVGWWTDGATTLENSRTGFGNQFVKGSRAGYVGATW